eukprot:5829605-Pleurochrysis_carterae.AAC.1
MESDLLDQDEYRPARKASALALSPSNLRIERKLGCESVTMATCTSSSLMGWTRRRNGQARTPSVRAKRHVAHVCVRLLAQLCQRASAQVRLCVRPQKTLSMRAFTCALLCVLKRVSVNAQHGSTNG